MALAELVKLSRIQTQQLGAMKPPRFKIKLANYCIIGLMFACLIAGIWVFNYLSTTGLGNGQFFSNITSGEDFTLLEFVTGSQRGSNDFASTEALFVVTTRFFLGIGISWVPLTLVIMVTDLLGQASLKRGD